MYAALKTITTFLPGEPELRTKKKLTNEKNVYRNCDEDLSEEELTEYSDGDYDLDLEEILYLEFPSNIKIGDFLLARFL